MQTWDSRLDLSLIYNKKKKERISTSEERSGADLEFKMCSERGLISEPFTCATGERRAVNGCI